MSKAEPKYLSASDDPPWAGIKLPWERISNPIRYLRAELGHAFCRKYPNFECVEVKCPVDKDEECYVTICRTAGVQQRSISSEGDHTSKEVLEAILRELE